jgi:hypothetical protein
MHGNQLLVPGSLPVHRSAVAHDYSKSLGRNIKLQRRPAYAPEPNFVEYLLVYAKHRESANLCAQIIGVVRRHAPLAG